MTMRTRNYAWLDSFWTDVISRRDGRHWVVATLFHDDLFLRDALAYALVRERLHGRSDVRYRFVKAWSAAPCQEELPGANILFLGRPRPFSASALGLFATRLEGGARGRFQDPNDGSTGRSIQYGRRLLSRRELDGPPARYHRCDLDYGILLCRQEVIAGQERRCVSIGGLGTLGTVGLTLLLTDDARRRELTDQVRALAPSHPGMHPESSAEICVRISVDGEESLANFLNSPEFHFRVDAVAIAGDEVRVREAVGVDVILIPAAGPSGGGELRVSGGGTMRLSRSRFALLRGIVERPARATQRDLCQYLGFVDESGEVREVHRRHLAKLVHDLNASLRGVIPSPAGERVIQFRKREECYVLVGVQVSMAVPGAQRPRP